MNSEHFTIKSLFLGDQMSWSMRRETRAHYYKCFPCYLKVLLWAGVNMTVLMVIVGIGLVIAGL